MEIVFLDTGIFVAFLTKKDQWHQQAVNLFSQPKPRWCTSFLIMSESYSWFLHRRGEDAARKFRSFFAELDGLTVFDITREHHHYTLEMLDQYRGTKLTYVDASSLCFINSTP